MSQKAKLCINYKFTRENQGKTLPIIALLGLEQTSKTGLKEYP